MATITDQNLVSISLLKKPYSGGLISTYSTHVESNTRPTWTMRVFGWPCLSTVADLRFVNNSSGSEDWRGGNEDKESLPMEESGNSKAISLMVNQAFYLHRISQCPTSWCTWCTVRRKRMYSIRTMSLWAISPTPQYAQNSCLPLLDHWKGSTTRWMCSVRMLRFSYRFWLQ